MDLEDLLEDINVYCELEQDTHLDYWKVSKHTKESMSVLLRVQGHLLTMQDMTIVCVDELQKLKRLEEGGKGQLDFKDERLFSQCGQYHFPYSALLRWD